MRVRLPPPAPYFTGVERWGPIPAIAEYDKAIELDPRYAPAYYNRGNAYYKLENVDQALADYDKAIELNPNYAPAYSNRGIAHRKLGNLGQALDSRL